MIDLMQSRVDGLSSCKSVSFPVTVDYHNTASQYSQTPDLIYSIHGNPQSFKNLAICL